MNTVAVMDSVADWKADFRRTFEHFDEESPVLILTHHDADGLAAAAICKRSFARLGRHAEVRISGKGENPWTDAVQLELRDRPMGGLIVADLGVRPGVVHPNTPTIFLDHHHPLGYPPDATIITGFGIEPTPPSGLLAYWCMEDLVEVEDLTWLAAISIIGDMAEQSGFAELESARDRYGITLLRDATSLLNAARRSGSVTAQPAFELLLKAAEPRDVISGKFPETQVLLKARDEVAQALQVARRTAPKIKGNVALIMVDSPCQIHPLIAQQWKARLRKNIVMAANKGYRPGWVHFSIRSATGLNLIDFLKENAPSTADENYGSGHIQATGGALTYPAWNEFMSSLGFGPETNVNA
jgi:single-stranded-DNA-specific exonuclease